MSKSSRDCPICHEPNASFQQSLDVSSTNLIGIYRCTSCGPFILVPELDTEGWPASLSDVDRGALRGVLLRRSERPTRHPLRITADAVPGLIAESGRPANADELITLLLTVVGREASNYGSQTGFHAPGLWASRLFLHPNGSALKLIRALEQRNWLAVYGPRASGDTSHALELTLSGWGEYHVRQRRGAASSSAFIATWADASISEEPVLSLCEAVKRAGLQPIVGNMLGGLDRVTEDIEAGIRRSRLLIADFTGARNGVYWEAGFARGLGLPVIYCCHSSATGKTVELQGTNGSPEDHIVSRPWREGLHFDTNQFPHIFWSSPEDLSERVLSRIRANGWDEAPRPRTS